MFIKYSLQSFAVLFLFLFATQSKCSDYSKAYMPATKYKGELYYPHGWYRVFSMNFNWQSEQLDFSVSKQNLTKKLNSKLGGGIVFQNDHTEVLLTEVQFSKEKIHLSFVQFELLYSFQNDNFIELDPFVETQIYYIKKPNKDLNGFNEIELKRLLFDIFSQEEGVEYLNSIDFAKIFAEISPNLKQDLRVVHMTTSTTFESKLMN